MLISFNLKFRSGCNYIFLDQGLELVSDRDPGLDHGQEEGGHYQGPLEDPTPQSAPCLLAETIPQDDTLLGDLDHQDIPQGDTTHQDALGHLVDQGQDSDHIHGHQ